MSDHRSRRARLGQFALGALLVLSLAACGGGDATQGTVSGSSDQPSVPPANNAPVITGDPILTAKAGVSYSFVPSASDPNNDTLTFSIHGMPAWASFDPATGALSGTPGDADVGTTGDIDIGVSDGKAESTLTPFHIQVAPKDATPPPPNHAPVISGTPATLVTATQSYIFIPTASDADNDKLTFSIGNRPQWATFNTTTGQLSGTPASTDARTYNNITITVSDGKASSSLPAFTLTVQPVSAPANTAPTIISGSPPTSVQAGTAYAFNPSAKDAENDTLTWSIENKPTWAAFNTATGALSGTPSSANVGTFSGIRISVSDGKLTTPMASFNIVVTAAPTTPPPANTAPTISGTPTTSVRDGAAYSFTPTAADANKDTLSFSIANMPSWASFSIATGALTGTAKAGTYANIIISVSDGKATTSLAAFTITVAANKPPVISGSPTTSVNTGTAYDFTPSASDPDGDTITFSITNKPSWATFSTTTGHLTGTPAASDAGTTPSIVISVSDGKATASLAAFQITIKAPAATGAATLTWTAPATNTDGTQVSGLAGYRIYYGQSASALTQTVTVSDPLATSGTVTGLSAATWYFSMTAFTNDGSESAPTTPVSKVVN